MFQKRVDAFTIIAWLTVAMSAPFALLAGKEDWLGLLLAVVFTGTLSYVISGIYSGALCYSRVYCLSQYVFLCIVLGYFADWSQDAWPTGADFPVVPLTLLALAVLSALRGAQAASRVGGILFWLIAGLYGVMLTFGSKDLKLSFLQPELRPVKMQSLLVLLVPGVTQFIPREMKPAQRWGISLVGILFVALSLWTIGGLSGPIAENIQWPFYEAGKSVSVLGIAERLESFISVAVTLGFFALYSMLLTAAGSLAENINPEWGKKGVIAAGITAAVIMLVPVRLPVAFLLCGALLLWGILPFVACRFYIVKKE